MIATIGTIVLWLLAIALICVYPLSELARGQATNPDAYPPSKGALIASIVGGGLVILLLTGCATTPVYGEIPECELLVPPMLLQREDGVPIPSGEDKYADGHEKAEPYQTALVGQTGQLEKANDKPSAVDHIYRGCLQMHRNALKRAKRGVFGRLFN